MQNLDRFFDLICYLNPVANISPDDDRSDRLRKSRLEEAVPAKEDSLAL